MNAKPWYQSRTVIVNLLVIVATIVTEVVPALPKLTGRQAEIALGVLAVANTIVRLYTNAPVAGSPGERAAAAERGGLSSKHR